MTNVPVTVRREKEFGNLALFFINSNGIKSWITCFTKIDSHSEADRGYMENDCDSVDQNDPEVIEFVKLWESLPPKDYKAVICENI
jgi:hypothetical protein